MQSYIHFVVYISKKNADKDVTHYHVLKKILKHKIENEEKGGEKRRGSEIGSEQRIPKDCRTSGQRLIGTEI